MRILPAALVGLITVLYLGVLPSAASPGAGRTRTYFIAAEETLWDYTPTGRDDAMGQPFDDFEKHYTEAGLHRIGHIYKKAIYREYTDRNFNAPKAPLGRGSVSGHSRSHPARRSRRHNRGGVQK